MSGHAAYRSWQLACLLSLSSAVATAQSVGDTGPQTHRRPLSAGGGVSAVVSPKDENAFFNYTSYDSNSLRAIRVRLFGEWKLHASLSFVGELRVENGHAGVPGLYVRWRPWMHGNLDVQAGRILPVFGGFGRRVYDRDNLVFGTPLAYQYLTSLRADALPFSTSDLLRMRGRGWRPSYPIGSTEIRPGLPLVSAAHWDTGVEAHWQAGRVEAAGAWTRGSPAQPVVRETNSGSQWSGRAAFMLPSGMTVAASAAHGAWISDDVLRLLPADHRSRTSQSAVGTDVEYGSGPWLVRGEWIRSVFDLPVGQALEPALRLVAWSGFVESRYRVHPRWDVAVRTERLAFSKVASPLAGGAATTWDYPVNRIETALTFRASRRFELRVGWQENWRSGGRVTRRGFPAAGLLWWF